MDALTCKNNNGAQLDLYNFFHEEVVEFFLFLRGAGPIWCRDLKIWEKVYYGIVEFLFMRWRARIGWLCGDRGKYKFYTVNVEEREFLNFFFILGIK